MPRLQPMITAGALGVAAGFIRKYDVDKGRNKLTSQYGTYLEGGAAIAGYVLDMAHVNINRETADALAFGGTALLAERITRSARSGDFGSGAPMGIAGRSYAGAGFSTTGGRPNFASGFSQKEPSLTII